MFISHNYDVINILYNISQLKYHWWPPLPTAPSLPASPLPYYQVLTSQSCPYMYRAPDDINRLGPGPVFSYKLRYMVGFWLVEMAISTNQKPTIYRKVYENTAVTHGRTEQRTLDS